MKHGVPESKPVFGALSHLEGERVRFNGESRSVVNGPFERDLIAGYWLRELPGIDNAVAWVKRCANPMPTPSEIQIRPI